MRLVPNRPDRAFCDVSKGAFAEYWHCDKTFSVIALGQRDCPQSCRFLTVLLGVASLSSAEREKGMFAVKSRRKVLIKRKVTRMKKRRWGDVWRRIVIWRRWGEDRLGQTLRPCFHLMVKNLFFFSHISKCCRRSLLLSIQQPLCVSHGR